MGRKATKGKRTLRTDRIFEASRLGIQAMAASYEALVPIKRKKLTNQQGSESAMDPEQAVGDQGS